MNLPRIITIPLCSAVLFLSFGAACEGTIGEVRPPWTPPPSMFEEGSVDFECSAGALGQDAPLRRLSRNQLRNTLFDTLTELLGDQAGAVESEVSEPLEGVPADLRTEADQDGQLLFFRSDQSVGSSAVAAHYRLSLALGTSLATDARLEAMGFECLTNADTSDDATCIDDFIQRIGALSHRRPLAEDEFRFYRDEVYAEGDVVDLLALSDLVTVLFAQPNFLFHVEGTGELNAYEVAARLSYHFWDTMPDAQLRAAAQDGSLLTDAGWDTQVDRLIESDRIQGAIHSFLSEWLRFDQINVASTGQGTDFEAIAGELELDESFDEAVQDELVDLFLYVLRSGGTFEDFFLSDVTTTQHPVLASIYGVVPAAPGEVVPLPAERRSILTRTGMLLARAEIALPNINSITHPILRGVFIRRQVVCDLLPPAPSGAMDNLPIVDRSVTGSRGATEILTAPPGCAGCHGRINSAGYALESFDAIGQFRTDEPLFNADGDETMRLPIDSRADILESAALVEGGVELAVSLYASEKVGACFARHYVRFALGRSERIVEDGCVLQAIDEAIDEGRSLKDVLTLVLLDPSFRIRAEN